MKRTNFFNKIALVASFGFLIVVAIFVGCQKDFSPTDFAATDLGAKSPSTSNYQKWFEAYTTKPQNATFAISEKFRGKIEPVWDNAVQIDAHLLEIPFKLDGNGISRNITKGYQESKISLVLRNNTNGSYKGFVVAISPIDTFSGSIDNINIHNFKTEKFYGVIAIYDLRGKYLDGYFVKNGKILAKISDKAMPRQTSLDQCCTEYCESIEAQWCTCVCTSNTGWHCSGSCSPPSCITISGGVWCYLDNCYECDDGQDDNCPNPNNPNCSDCPNSNDPNCDDGCGGCPGDDDTDGPGPGVQCSSFNFTTSGNLKAAATSDLKIAFIDASGHFAPDVFSMGTITTMYPNTVTTVKSVSALGMSFALGQTSLHFRNSYMFSSESEVREYFMGQYNAAISTAGGCAHGAGLNFSCSAYFPPGLLTPTSVVQYPIWDPRWLSPNCD